MEYGDVFVIYDSERQIVETHTVFTGDLFPEQVEAPLQEERWYPFYGQTIHCLEVDSASPYIEEVSILSEDPTLQHNPEPQDASRPEGGLCAMLPGRSEFFLSGWITLLLGLLLFRTRSTR